MDDKLEAQQQGARWRHHDNSSIASRQSVGEDARNNGRLQSVRVVSTGQTVLAVATCPQVVVRGRKDNHGSAHTNDDEGTAMAGERQ